MMNYDEWAQSIKDHVCRTNRSWEQLLEWVAPLPNPITYNQLCTWHVGGVNGWLISTKLETFLVGWLSKSLKARRLALCHGQKGNGLEMWRRLYCDYKGDRRDY